MVASHNAVSDSLYSGIAVGWQSGGVTPSPLPPPSPTPASSPVFLVEHNTVTQYGQGALSDFGGLYVSAWATDHCWANPDPAQHGCWLPTLFRGNYVAHGRHYNYGSNGGYMDEAVSGVTYAGNVLADVGNAGLYFHCGAGNAAVGNILWAAQAQGTGGEDERTHGW
jgi:hypothetical protein